MASHYRIRSSVLSKGFIQHPKNTMLCQRAKNQFKFNMIMLHISRYQFRIRPSAWLLEGNGGGRDAIT